jgi:hypothetical protein
MSEWCGVDGRLGAVHNRVPFGLPALLLCAVVACACVQQVTAQSGRDSYLEFGRVVALGKRDVQIETFDPRKQRTVERSFALTRDTRADVVHAGDTVELIYVVGPAQQGTNLELRRLLVLRDGVPIVGSSPSVVPASSMSLSDAALAASVSPSAKSPANRAVVPMRSSIPATTPGRVTARVPSRDTSVSAAIPRDDQPVRGAGSAAQPVALGSSAKASVPGVIAVPLGDSDVAKTPGVPRVTGIAHAAPGAACDRSAGWAAQPISLAVLDFRYPTDNEEDHSSSGIGGGSGTSVADLVFAQLENDNTGFDLSRGDRQKLYRMDFAGAARMGRQLGVDLVLLGSFVPVDVPQPDPDFPVPAQFYTLRAGVVETCTGELVYKLTSITCAAGANGAQALGAPACPGAEISVKDSRNPDAHAASFRAPIENLLAPLSGGVEEGSRMGTAGLVQTVSGRQLTIRISPRAQVRVGDQVGVHASRLAKNPTTNTVHLYQDEEIGRLTIQRVNGATAVGTYTGDVPPRPGDTADLLAD